MANSRQSQNSDGVCEKLYNAMCCSCASHSPKTSTPAPTPPQTFPLSSTAGHAPVLKPAARQFPASGEVIPVEIDPHLSTVPQNSKDKNAKNMDSSQKSDQVTEVVDLRVQQQKKLKVQKSMNDIFTSYISRVKHGMMRTSTNVGSARISSRHDNSNEKVLINDHSSEYIRRAHMKMKNSSAATAGKNVTFK